MNIITERLKVAAGKQEDREDTGGKERQSGAERSQDANCERGDGVSQRTPFPGSSANCVTAGPGLISRTLASTLKLDSVSSINLALACKFAVSGATSS